MRKTTLSLVIGTLIASGAACAGNENGEESQYGSESAFKSHTESSAQLSVDNIEQVGASSAFARLDVDGNGKVSGQEATVMQGLNAELDSLDNDGDGALSFSEFAALAATSDMEGSSEWSDRSTLALDTETGVEVDSALGVAGIETEVETGTEVGSEYGMEGEGEVALEVEGITEINVEQTFETVDANGDNTVDSAEATSIAGLAEVFAQLDANADGELDYTEFKAVTSLNSDFGIDKS